MPRKSQSKSKSKSGTSNNKSKPYITIKGKTLKEAQKAYTHLSRIGTFTDRHLKELGINMYTMKVLEKAGLMEKRIHPYKDSVVYSFHSTPKGIRFAKSQLGIQRDFYHSKSVKHDMVTLADTYVFGLTEAQRDSLLNENELRDIWMEANKHDYDRQMQINQTVSAIDFAYKDESGKYVLVEILTDNYTDKEIQMKEEFASDLANLTDLGFSAEVTYIQFEKN